MCPQNTKENLARLSGEIAALKHSKAAKLKKLTRLHTELCDTNKEFDEVETKLVVKSKAHDEMLNELKLTTDDKDEDASEAAEAAPDITTAAGIAMLMIKLDPTEQCKLHYNMAPLFTGAAASSVQVPTQQALVPADAATIQATAVPPQPGTDTLAVAGTPLLGHMDTDPVKVKRKSDDVAEASGSVAPAIANAKEEGRPPSKSPRQVISESSGSNAIVEAATSAAAEAKKRIDKAEASILGETQCG
jgi:hypothetical protein